MEGLTRADPAVLLCIVGMLQIRTGDKNEIQTVAQLFAAALLFHIVWIVANGGLSASWQSAAHAFVVIVSQLNFVLKAILTAILFKLTDNWTDALSQYFKK